MLYLLEKNVIHSLSTVLFSSVRSDHSGTQSSGFRDDLARAREGSLPANTMEPTSQCEFLMSGRVLVPW